MCGMIYILYTNYVILKVKKYILPYTAIQNRVTIICVGHSFNFGLRASIACYSG